MSFCLSGLAESPLLLIGLVPRLAAAELQLELELEFDVCGFNRLGIMRTMSVIESRYMVGVPLKSVGLVSWSS